MRTIAMRISPLESQCQSSRSITTTLIAYWRSIVYGN